MVRFLCRLLGHKKPNTIEDGWGSIWGLCDDPAFPEGCRLEVVRPGKVQCDCDGQGMRCLTCGLPMYDDWFLEQCRPEWVAEPRATHEVLNTWPNGVCD